MPDIDHGLPIDMFFGPDGPQDKPPHDFYRPDRGAPCNDDQLPAVAAVGRGLQGNGYRVRITDPDNCVETYLEGLRYDSQTGEWVSEWKSENINGGELSYQYNLRPFTIPQCFTITFIYRRPGRCEWSWTTPAIPYVWDANGDGEPDVDGIIGSGVATFFARTDAVDRQGTIKGTDPDDSKWNERLQFPDGTYREDFNTPLPGEAWTAYITFGLLHGDVLVPNLYDLAEVVGFESTNVYNVADSQPEQFQGGIRVDYGNYTFPNDTSDDLKHYIDENDRWLLDHFHKDLGFPEGNLPGDGDGGGISVKQYIDNLFNDLFKKIYWGGENSNPQYKAEGTPAGKVQEDGTILWTTPSSERIAVGNMNLYGGEHKENWIKTDDPGDNDVSAM